jgi:hypothetical protein
MRRGNGSGRLANAWRYAVPGGRLPELVVVDGRRYEHLETLKHDFFAATGVYRGPEGLAILKLGRTASFLGLPMAWLGELLEGHEWSLYGRASGIPGVPAVIGRVGRNGLLRAYVPGHPLSRREPVSDTFCDELLAILRRLHERHIAYVDLDKRQNILVGEDGKPHLIDFQIAVWLPPVGWRGWWPFRFILARLQEADYYHWLKHKRRLRPDLLTDEERRRLSRLSIWIRLHRAVARPLTYLRRRVLRMLRDSADAVPGASAK